MRQIFIDTETTGLNTLDGHRIVEFGAVEMVNRRLTGKSLHLYFNPAMLMPDEAMKIHGLTDAFLADKPSFQSMASEIAQFIGDSEIIAHNGPFDQGFLDNEFLMAEMPTLAGKGQTFTCSMELGKSLLGKRMSLDGLVKHFNIHNTRHDLGGLHGAMIDASLLALAYVPLTQAQDSFFSEEEITQEAAGQVVDLSACELPILYADEDEIAADLAYREEMRPKPR